MTNIVYYITVHTSGTVNLDLQSLKVKVSVGDVHQADKDHTKGEERILWQNDRYMIQMAHGTYCHKQIIINQTDYTI